MTDDLREGAVVYFDKVPSDWHYLTLTFNGFTSCEVFVVLKLNADPPVDPTTN